MAVALGVAALALALGGARAQEDKKGHMHKHFEKCAKACAVCMLECESCATHCGGLVLKGEKKHVLTLRTCLDCAEVCASAAKIVARQGPASVLVCESCAKVCDQCGAVCEKLGPDDEHMKRCAKACRDCARECREMIKHAGHDRAEKREAVKKQ
jgi:hypothetical protein